MTKGQKLFLGVVSIVPLIYVLALIFTPLKKTFSLDFTSPDTPDWLLYFTAFHFLMYLYTGLLIAFYLIHLFGNPGMKREEKIAWAFFLIVGSVFTIPLYWFFKIWKYGR